MEENIENKVIKKGILIVSFGTSYRDAEESSIKPVENAVAKAFRDYEVRRAFTSNIIIRKLAKEGRIVPAPSEAVRAMANTGFSHLIIQPLLFMKGYEFNNKIVEPLTALRGLFEEFVISDPLLYTEDDFRQMQEIITRMQSSANNEPILLMGHGTEHPANAVYQKLQTKLDRKCSDVFVATVEGSPGLDNIVPLLKKGGIKRIHLFPLMLVAGDHARNDMAGDNENSWRSILMRLGIEGVPHLRGMGESIELHRLVIKHIHKSQQLLFPV